MDEPVLIIPGIGNSGPEHWQTLWEVADPSMVRIRVKDWDRPSCVSWVKAIDADARRAGEPLVVVAHSLGCLAFVNWAAQSRQKIRGALLVAVPDPHGTDFPGQAVGFAQIPLVRLSCRSIVVSSQDDPYCSREFPQRCAEALGSRLVDIGRAGHINSASNLGSWPAGLMLLEELRSAEAAQR